MINSWGWGHMGTMPRYAKGQMPNFQESRWAAQHPRSLGTSWHLRPHFGRSIRKPCGGVTSLFWGGPVCGCKNKQKPRICRVLHRLRGQMAGQLLRWYKFCTYIYIYIYSVQGLTHCIRCIHTKYIIICIKILCIYKYICCTYNTYIYNIIYIYMYTNFEHVYK